jgi:hypothetical protein
MPGQPWQQQQYPDAAWQAHAHAMELQQGAYEAVTGSIPPWQRDQQLPQEPDLAPPPLPPQPDDEAPPPPPPPPEPDDGALAAPDQAQLPGAQVQPPQQQGTDAARPEVKVDTQAAEGVTSATGRPNQAEAAPAELKPYTPQGQFKWAPFLHGCPCQSSLYVIVCPGGLDALVWLTPGLLL